MLRLSANENCYGCSPGVLEALNNKSHDVHLYPDFNPTPLEEKLAEFLNVSQRQVAIGAGSVRVIDGLIQVFVNTGEEVITFERSFSAYGQLAAMHKRKCCFAPLKGFRCDVNNIFPFINSKTRLIFIANPNNPTGTIITHEELKGFLGNISPDILVVVDEAYKEYVTDQRYPDSLQLQKEFPNLVIVRTFSKIYGLAGLRIGYAIANDMLAATMKEGRIPYSLNSLAIPAALAAMDDQTFLMKSAAMNDIQREKLYHELKRLNYHVVPSQANFIYWWFDKDDEKIKIFHYLLENGIKVCNLNIFGQDRSLRVTVGDEMAVKNITGYLRQIITSPSASPQGFSPER